MVEGVIKAVRRWPAAAVGSALVLAVLALEAVNTAGMLREAYGPWAVVAGPGVAWTLPLAGADWTTGVVVAAARRRSRCRMRALGSGLDGAVSLHLRPCVDSAFVTAPSARAGWCLMLSLGDDITDRAWTTADHKAK